MSFLGGLAGGAIGGAVVNLYLDDKNFKTGLASAEAQTKGATTSMGGSFSKFKAVAAPAMAALGVAAVAYGAKAVQAASDQEEALNKVRVVFGDSSAVVEAFAQTTAENLGLSETAALSAAGTFGNFFTAAGLAADDVTNMSTSVVTLAADLASFNNIDPTIALEKLRAGLAGEAEPLRQLGVFLSEARVAEEAYASGLAKTGEELTDAQKVQARYNLILADTGTAQGDFARTSDSLANQQRILAAKMDDLAATVGETLLPVIKELLPALTGMLERLQAIAEFLPTLVPWIERTVGAIERGIPAIAAFNDALGGDDDFAAFQAGAEAINAALDSQEIGVGRAIDRLNALSEATGVEVPGGAEAMVDAMRATEDAAAGAGDEIKETTTKMREARKAAKEAAKEYRDGVKEAFSVAGESVFGFKAKFEGTVRSFTTGLNNMRKRAQETLKDLREFNKIDLGKGVKEFLLDQGPAAIDAFTDANKRGRKAIVDDIGAILKAQKDAGVEIDRATQKTNDLTGAMGKLGQKKVTATAAIKYVLAEGSLDPGQLPGLAQGNG